MFTGQEHEGKHVFSPMAPPLFHLCKNHLSPFFAKNGAGQGDDGPTGQVQAAAHAVPPVAPLQSHFRKTHHNHIFFAIWGQVKQMAALQGKCKLVENEFLLQREKVLMRLRVRRA